MSAQQLDHYSVYAIRRPIAVLQFALRVGPLVNDRRGHA
jgi:hypothetical protein